ncbi:mycothiol system anti-sigma-R factor [Cellulomonas fimi]|uniref:Mycothiol system anti-sigma-R factor n=1 Tax=Cellulomonas fimi TaxID=1708 RepID=A0A7Y0M0I8_CELFI|nr:mycothiol system anti-sigma-R factor [Cellulomonas fimi]NMR20818.1 mycothiol system anti-sigma-R factor [Cellulomonas fimi]
MTADQAGRSDRAECAEALEKLSEFLDQELDESAGDRIREHLADCEPCLAEYDVEDHIKKLVKRSCSEKAPLELQARIRTQLTILRTQLPG